MQRKSFFQRPQFERTAPETFAFKVEGYDTQNKPHSVTGVRLDTGDRVTVYLRDVEYNRKSGFARTEIVQFEAPRQFKNDPGTVAGGVMLATEAFKQGNGTFGARWLQALSHAPGEADVFMATVNVSRVGLSNKKSEEFPDGRPFSRMTVMFDGDFRHISPATAKSLDLLAPFHVDSTEALREALIELKSTSPKTGLGVRISNSDPEKGDVGMDAMYLKDDADMTVEQVVDRFMTEHVEKAADAINAGSLSCEVLPFSTLWGGPATVKIMAKNPVHAGRVKMYNREEANEQNEGTHNVPMYRPTIVAVRRAKADEHGHEAPYFSAFEPLMTRYPTDGLISTLCYAKTQTLSIDPPKPEVRRTAEQNQAPAGNEGAPGADGNFNAGGPESGISDDDLIQAAGIPTGDSGDIGDDIPHDPLDEPQVQTETPPPAARANRYTRGARA